MADDAEGPALIDLLLPAAIRFKDRRLPLVSLFRVPGFLNSHDVVHLSPPFA
jgi:hypothetical protein